jgi:hypothetical protein
MNSNFKWKFNANSYDQDNKYVLKIRSKLFSIELMTKTEESILWI